MPVRVDVLRVPQVAALIAARFRGVDPAAVLRRPGNIKCAQGDQDRENRRFTGQVRNGSFLICGDGCSNIGGRRGKTGRTVYEEGTQRSLSSQKALLLERFCGL